MLTISRLMEALTSPAKIKISQNKLANCFNTSTSTINAWVNKDTQPHLTADDIYKGINDCRVQYPTYQNETDFVEKIINCLDIDPWEKDSLEMEFNIYKNRYPSDGTCSSKFLKHLIQMALEKKEIGSSLAYDPFDPVHPVVGIGIEHVIAALDDGRVVSSGANDYQQCETHAWRDIISVSAGWRSSLGLKSDGTCVVVGKNTVGDGEIFRWRNLTAVCCGPFHFLGLKRDGTVVSYGLGGDGQRDVSDWRHVKALAAGIHHTVGLCEDGSVLACGSNREGQCEVSSWKNVKQIAAAGEHTVALTKEGTILYAGDPYIYDFSGWKDVQSIATGIYHIVGLKKDGTVLLTGQTIGGLDSVYKWWDMKAIYAGFYTTAGIHADGSVWITNDKYNRTHLNTSSWNIHDEHTPKDSGLSPFEAARKEVISILENIRDTGFRLVPALRNSVLDAENADRLEEIRKLCRDSWDYREKIMEIKPLADMILSYNAAFLDFSRMFSVDETRECVAVSENAYDACIEFLTAVRMLLMDVRSI